MVEKPVFEVVDDFEGEAGPLSGVIFSAHFSEPGEGVGVFEVVGFGFGVVDLGEEIFLVGEVPLGEDVETFEHLAESRSDSAGANVVIELVEDNDHFFMFAVDGGNAKRESIVPGHERHQAHTFESPLAEKL